jgi:hypothetical protein
MTLLKTFSARVNRAEQDIYQAGGTGGGRGKGDGIIYLKARPRQIKDNTVCVLP